MKRIIFFLLCLFVIVPSDVFGARIKVRTKLEVPDFDFYVDSVIVLQEEQKVIGHMSEHKKLKPFRLKEKRIDLMLQNLFQRSFPEKEGKRRLILKVNRIIYNTFDNNSEFGANITFIENVDGRQIELGSFKMFDIHQVDLDKIFFIARVRGEDLVNHLQSYLKEFVDYEKSIEKESLQEHDELGHIARFELNNENFPILANNQLTYKGIIKTFDDFTQGKVEPYPDLKVDTIIYRKTKHNRVTVENDDFKHDSIWGIYDGEHYYIREGKFFRPVIFVNNRIFIHAPSSSIGFVDFIPFMTSLILTPVVTPLIFPNTITFGQAFAFGALIGGGIYGITEGIVRASKKYVYYEIDLLTGLVNQVETKEYKKHKTQ